MKSFLIAFSCLCFFPNALFANEIAQFETQSAVANFVGEESACERTLVAVFVSNHIERPEKTPVSGAFISIKKENFCTGTTLMDAVGAPVFNANEFTVKGSLKQAWLRAAFSVFDFIANNHFPIAVDLSWRSTGRAVRSWSLTSDDFIFIVAKEARKSYLANASGQISNGIENFTPDPSQNGVIGADDNLFVIRN
jgi:hypothetical protein